MAAEGTTTKIQGELFMISTGLVTKPTNGWTESEADSIIGASDANLVPEVREIGEMGAEANILSFGIYGKAQQTQASGQGTPPTFTFTVVNDYNLTKHQAIHALAAGAALQLVYRVETAPGDANYIILDGTLASKLFTPAGDDVETLVVGVAVADQSDPIAAT